MVNSNLDLDVLETNLSVWRIFWSDWNAYRTQIDSIDIAQYDDVYAMIMELFCDICYILCIYLRNILDSELLTNRWLFVSATTNHVFCPISILVCNWIGHVLEAYIITLLII